ncbi:MAG: hypothetical protein ABSG52_12560 [Terriglobales bacterium]|jgi:hypothetical protein
MRRGAGVAIQVVTLLVLSVSPWWLFAQTAKPPSLKEQLEAQFPAETVLVIQKTGVLGVALASSKTCAAKYQDGKLSPPDASCTAPLKISSRPLAVGQKVNPAKIDVDLARERISFRIVECASCNKGSESSPYKSQIDFQFGKGYLEKTGVSQIEDTISEVLAFDAGADQQTQGQPGEAHDEVLTNGDVVKMAKAKLGDAIIISTIRASACNFDTSVNAMVKLKEAGVSDPVIQAMRDAQAAAQAPAPEPAANEPAPAGNPVAGHYVNEQNVAEYLDLLSDDRFIWKLLKRGGLAFIGSYEISGDMLTLRNPGGSTSTLKLNGERLIDHEGKSWVRQGEPQSQLALAPVPGQVSFSVRHRHSLWNTPDSLPHYCSGILSVSPDGTVAYDCAETEDPSGRCEHVSFAPGSLKEAKIRSGGYLHLATKIQGNFDFYATRGEIQQALAAIAPLIQK